MTSSTPSLESCPLGADLVAPDQPARLLPSGRSVVVRVATGGDEELEVRRLDGTLEVRIRLTADGPVLQLQGTRLELEAADVVASSAVALKSARPRTSTFAAPATSGSRATS